MSRTEGDRRMTAVQQSAAPHPAVRQRIDWIDTAKGLCMILVIVGHTLPYGNLMRNFIFSFHMPAFFFLTGYTARRPDTWQGFARRVRKDFVALIVPVLGVVQVFNVLLNFFLSDDRSLTNLWDIARYNAITLFWASGNPADGIPSCGMPWFLFALFWGKLIWELLGLLFPKGILPSVSLSCCSGHTSGRYSIFPNVWMLQWSLSCTSHWGSCSASIRHCWTVTGSRFSLPC